MALLDALLGVALVALCIHVAVLFVQLAHALLRWRRRDPSWTSGIAAAVAGLCGELVVLGALIGRTPSLPWVLGLLGGSFALGLVARPTWNAHAAGRAGRSALLAAPLGLAVAALLLARAV